MTVYQEIKIFCVHKAHFVFFLLSQDKLFWLSVPWGYRLAVGLLSDDIGKESVRSLGAVGSMFQLPPDCGPTPSRQKYDLEIAPIFCPISARMRVGMKSVWNRVYVIGVLEPDSRLNPRLRIWARD